MNIKTIKGTFLIIICIVIVNQISVAQVIKKYNGTYNTNVSFDGDNYANSEGGIASYSYYENKDFERIYHGTFLYESKYHEIKINGSFKSNKKDGYWVYKNEMYYSVETVKGKYINGVLQGLWVYQEINKKSKKVLKESIVNFKDGILVGKYFLKIDKFKAIGNFDSNGRGVGEWLINYKIEGGDKIEIKRKYENDIITWSLKRNISNGEIMKDNKNIENEYYGNDDYGNNKGSRYYFYFDKDNINGHDILGFWLEPERFSAMDYKCPIFEYIVKGSDFISFEEREKKLNPNKQNENFNKVDD